MPHRPTIAIDTAPTAADQLVKDHPDATIVIVAVGSTVGTGKLSLSILVPNSIPRDLEHRMRADIARRILSGETAIGRAVRVEP